MSESKNEPKPDMTYSDACNVLTQAVFAEPFFAKLANDYDIRPQTEDEAMKLLALADRLNVIDEMGSTKSAQDRGGFLDQLLTKLDSAIGTAPQSASHPGIQKAAAVLAADSTVRDAALLFHDALQQLQSK